LLRKKRKILGVHFFAARCMSTTASESQVLCSNFASSKRMEWCGEKCAKEKGKNDHTRKGKKKGKKGINWTNVKLLPSCFFVRLTHAYCSYVNLHLTAACIKTQLLSRPVSRGTAGPFWRENV